MAEGKIAAAVGSATATKKLGNPIEELMAAEVLKASAEAEAIWKDEKLSPEDKQKKIAAIMSDDAIRARKLKARADYKEALRKKAEEEGAAARVQALKDSAARISLDIEKEQKK